MKLRSIAWKGMAVLLVVVALCLFFSGTIRTVFTPKVQFVTVKMGRLTEQYELSAALTYNGKEKFSFAVPESVQVSQVFVREGDQVQAGDPLFSLRFYGEKEREENLLTAYREALTAQMDFDRENRKKQPGKQAVSYMEAYKALKAATINEGAARLELDRLLPPGVLLPESGYPEGADGMLRQAVDSWRAASQQKSEAQTAFDKVSASYEINAWAWQYLLQEQEITDRLEAAKQALAAFYTQRDMLRTVTAPHAGFVASMTVRAGSGYDGTSSLCEITSENGGPVIRADLNEMKTSLPDGIFVTLETPWGEFEPPVLFSGIDLEGDRYADIALPDALMALGVPLRRMAAEELTVHLTLQSEETNALLPVTAIHGTGADRYVYVAEERQAVLGSTEWIVTKQPITVLAEADGMVAVKENLNRARLAMLEDRPLSDGSAVMEASP